MRHKLRTGLTALGVMIGVLLIVSLGSFSEGIEKTVNRELSFLSGLVTVAEEGIDYQSVRFSELDESLVEELGQMSNVEKAAGFLFVSIPNVPPITGFNVEDLDVTNFDVGIKEGRYYEEGSNEIMAGANIADKLHLSVGDNYKIRDVEYEVVGIFEKTGTSDDDGLFASLEIAQEMAGKEDKVSVILLKPENAEESEAIAREINENYDEVIAATDKDAARSAKDFTGQLNAMTVILSSISAIIAGIGIMNVMFMSVRERKREIGTMKALGATGKQIMFIILVESTTISLFGAIVGIGLSYLVVYQIGLIGAIAVITPKLLFKAVMFAVFLGLFAGFLPARQASKLDPITALRYE